MLINSLGEPILGNGFMLSWKPSSSPSISSVFKYRDRGTIINDILISVKNSGKGRKKTQIMQSANLNYLQMNKYLTYLMNCGFITVTEKQTYFITNKGAKFLQLVEFQKINSLR